MKGSFLTLVERHGERFEEVRILDGEFQFSGESNNSAQRAFHTFALARTDEGRGLEGGDTLFSSVWMLQSAIGAR
jgi:hypothetical protein